MNNIKLSIFTGVQDTDIIDLGLYNPSISSILSTAVPDPKRKYDDFANYINGMSASQLSALLQKGINDIDTSVDRYKVFQVSDLLAARDYLNKLKIACDTYPDCTVKIETL